MSFPTVGQFLTWLSKSTRLWREEGGTISSFRCIDIAAKLLFYLFFVVFDKNFTGGNLINSKKEMVGKGGILEVV
jgi:hypothetical protein